jgi:hypothetical protein
VLDSYDARMLSRQSCITEFIWHALRRELAEYPEWAFDAASEAYSKWRDLSPTLVADALCSEMNRAA